MVEQRPEASRRRLTSGAEGRGYVVPLRECASLGVDQVGGKAWNLSQLLVLGYPVPDGFVLTTQAFERFLMAGGLGSESSPDAAVSSALPDEVKDALLEAAGSLG